ncbi:hypothetical protein BST61_g10360 [Cercospora zeina]
MTKDELVARLEALDRAATFPLMSLPKELRLCIYDDLMFYPQILATNREINAEARPIQEGRHTVTTLRIALRPTPPERRLLGQTSESAIKVNDGPWLPPPPNGNDSFVDSLEAQLSVRVQVENLPSVDDVFGQPRNSPEELLQDICWPLLLMGRGVELVIQGFPDEATTALYRYRNLQDRLHEVIDLGKEAGIGWRCFELLSALRRAQQMGGGRSLL